MAARELRGRLPDADVADVNAATDSFSVLEPLRHLDEPCWLMARGVLQEDQGAAWPLAQMRIEIAHRAKQAVCLCRHLMLVMDDQAGHAAREAVGELPDHGAATLVQHVDAAIQVDHGQARVRRHEPEDVLKILRCVGIYLGRQAHLGKAEASEFQQRIIAGDAALEQAVNRPECLPVRFLQRAAIIDAHHASLGLISAKDLGAEFGHEQARPAALATAASSSAQ
jgi:hypothetical protein